MPTRLIGISSADTEQIVEGKRQQKRAEGGSDQPQIQRLDQIDHHDAGQ